VQFVALLIVFCIIQIFITSILFLLAFFGNQPFVVSFISDTIEFAAEMGGTAGSESASAFLDLIRPYLLPMVLVSAGMIVLEVFALCAAVSAKKARKAKVLPRFHRVQVGGR